MKPLSCGLLLYEFENEDVKFLLGKPGGEWNKHSPWTIPKGLKEHYENDDLSTAIRETEEELGISIVINETLYDLGIKSNEFKCYHIFGMEYDIDILNFKSNMCEFTWKGKTYIVPEISEIKWFTLKEAEKICSKYQFPFLQDMYFKIKGLL